MASEGRRASGFAAAVAACVLTACLPGGAEAQQAEPKSLIYSCVLNGKRLTRDRPISECTSLEQRVLNSDGSQNRIIPPTMSEDERQQAAECERESEADRVARNEEVRRDRNAMQRYPNEVAHRKARAKALDDIRNAVNKSNERKEILLKERKPLLEEAEFYIGKPLPLKLKLALDANDAALDAQRALIQNQEVEVKRLNDLYDVELGRLRLLWAGAPPGSFYRPLPLSPACSKRASR